jgi:predicted MFS family arabinose efflux permease
MKLLFLNTSLKILLITNAMILAAGAMFGPIYAMFVEKIGGTLLDAGLTIGIFSLVAGTTTLISGKYVDKIKENELIIVFGYVLTGVGFLLYILVSSIWDLFLVEMLIGFAEAIYWPAYDTLYSKHLTSNRAGREWGTWESMRYFTVAASSIIGGLIVTNSGFNTVFVIMATLCFSSAIYIYFLPRKLL